MRISRASGHVNRATIVVDRRAGEIVADRVRRRVIEEEARVAMTATSAEAAALRRAGARENRADLAASGTIAISAHPALRSRRCRELRS
jgi:hypothetical protein